MMLSGFSALANKDLGTACKRSTTGPDRRTACTCNLLLILYYLQHHRCRPGDPGAATVQGRCGSPNWCDAPRTRVSIRIPVAGRCRCHAGRRGWRWCAVKIRRNSPNNPAHRTAVKQACTDCHGKGPDGAHSNFRPRAVR